jgi:hypothetical protein
MKGLIRLFLVLNLAAGLVALVLYFDRHYGPRSVEQWQQCLATLTTPGMASPENGWSDALQADAGATAADGVELIESSTSRDGRGSGSAAGAAAGVAPSHGGSPSGLQNLPLSTPDLQPCVWPAGSEPPTQSLAHAPLAPSPRPPQPFPRDASQDAARLRPLGSSPGSPAALLQRLHASESTGAPNDQTGALRGADPFDLMWQLQGTDEAAAARARAELQRRGCTEVHLELARRLFDPDPEVRRALARALPGLQSVDAAPWLLRLGRDDNAEVRLTAVTIMATTGDPAVLEQAEALARQDPDSRIREQVENIGRQREMAATRGEGKAGGGK